MWQSSLSNSNTNYQSFYFPPPVDFNNTNQYHSTDNYNFDYQSSSDISLTHQADLYSNFYSTNSYSMDPYSTQTVYNATALQSSAYVLPTDPSQNFYPMYTPSNVAGSSTSSPFDLQFDCQSVASQWNLNTVKMPSHDGKYIRIYIFMMFYIREYVPTYLFFSFDL